MIERKAYICEYCNSRRPIRKHVYLYKDAAERHERTCYYNPLVKSCFTCIHNDYIKQVNTCLIDKNVNFKSCLEYANAHGIENAKEEFSEWPVTLQVARKCEFWNDGSEGEG